MIDIESFQAALRRVCANRDWHLLDIAELGVTAESLAGRMADRLHHLQEAGELQEITAEHIERAAIYEYACLLHRAVGIARSTVQARALTEVWNYVTPIILKVLKEDAVAQACANNVLLIVWREHADMRDPGCFLYWAAVIAGREALRAARSGVRSEIPFSELVDDDGEDIEERIEALAAQGQLPLIETEAEFTRVEDAEQAVTLARIIRECLRRMRAGAEVIIRLVLLGQEVAQVAGELGLSAGNVHLVKFRALRRLRDCPALRTALGLSTAAVASGGGL